MIRGIAVDARLSLRRVPGRQEWRGACPAFGYKTGLAQAEKQDQTVWWYASCQDGGALTAAIRRALGGRWTPPREFTQTMRAPSAALNAALAHDSWDAVLPHPSALIDHYLAAHDLAGVQSVERRVHSATPHPGGGRLSAMFAAVCATGTSDLRAVHWTYLRRDDSGRAVAVPAKASPGPIVGGAMLLVESQPVMPLVIGGANESSLSAAYVIGGTVWCAASAGNLDALRLPPLPTCSELVIATDPDAPGQRAAKAAARHWHFEGGQIRIAAPDKPGPDFNNMLNIRLARENAHA